MQDYTHPQLDTEVTAIGGHYVFIKEMRVPHSGREVLYLVGYACVDTSCCGVGGCAFAAVPGYIDQWKYKVGENGNAVSAVDPIRDRKIQKEIGRVIKDKEMVNQVNFQ
jgi:hypothetical protein